MKPYLITVFCSLILFGCLDNDDIHLNESVYEGKFMRLTADTIPVQSPVTLTLNNGTFEGVADSLYYPAIGQGTYTIEGKTIHFTNTSVWTANFDWSFILQGEYVIEEEGTSKVFIQEVSAGVYNIYQFEQ